MHQRLLRVWVNSLCLLLLFSACGPEVRDEVRILVFSKTEGYRHASIPDGTAAIQRIAVEQGWQVDTTEDASNFNEENLQQYSAVVFLSTTGDVLDHYQQADFERYIQAGGGFVGIHAAADTEYDWAWYGRLVGAYFASHPNNPNVRNATMRILDSEHPSTEHFGDQKTWERSDEFYNFKEIYHGTPDGIQPLVDVDETTYEGGTNGGFHPMTWYHDYDGGRAWYTNFGHTKETFSEPKFLKMLEGGLLYAVGKNEKPDFASVRTERVPPAYRFRVNVLEEKLKEPTEMEILPDGRILWAQRRGELMLHDPRNQVTRQVGFIPVWNKFEDGMVGMALDPNFGENQQIFIYYAPADSIPRFSLSRFSFQGDSLINSSEKLIMEVPVQRDTCCHTGGSIEFGPDGLLYLSTGDDTNPFETRYAPIDEREGKEPWDAQRSSANPSDLRGKVLRIKPLAEGGYEVPPGNLFPADGSQGRPEIYVMGCRNPYRISIDPESGYLYWGDVGPDGRVDSTRGPRGYDEVNQARKPGFFGWPYFVGNNYPYRDVDFVSQTEQELFDPIHPVNQSRHNQGTQQLPPAQPAFIWYPYDNSPDFPLLGKGGRNAMAGPVYHHEKFMGTSSQFPKYYDDKLFVYDFMRDWVMVVNMDEEGDLETIEPFLPNEQMDLSSPTDMAFGPDGALYIINYGTRWFRQNDDATLVRIEYSEANREPQAIAFADKVVGAAPLEVNFSAENTIDYDDPRDNLQFVWTFPDASQQQGLQVNFTFTESGLYQVPLRVTDGAGNTDETQVEVRVGNEPPAVSVEVEGNQDFFWREKPINYQVVVSDREDGTLTEGGILPEAIAVSWDFGENEFDPTQEAAGHEELAAASAMSVGEALIQKNGCIACHGMKKKVIGPGYLEVAEKYPNNQRNVSYLAGKILKGGSGVWGGQAMPAMTQLNRTQATQIAKFVLAMGEQEGQSSLPTSGMLKADQHQGLGEGNAYTLRVSYQDQGGEKMGPLSGYVNQAFRSPKLEVEKYIDETQSSEHNVWIGGERGVVNVRKGGHFGLLPVDLSEVKGLTLRYKSEVSGGVTMEIRLDSPDGPAIGRKELPQTPGDDEFQNTRLPIETQEGRHRLYLVPVKGENKNANVGPLLIDWIYLEV